MKAQLTLLSFCLSFSIGAQVKPTLVQSQSIPTSEFTALAGTHGGLQMNAQYMNQWPKQRANRQVYFTNVDYYSPKLKTAVGFNISHTNDGNGTVQLNNIDLYATRRITLGDLCISPSAALALSNLNVDGERLTYGDQIHERYNFLSLSDNAHSSRTVVRVDAGLSAFYKSFYGAAQISNLNQPNIGLSENISSRMRLQYAFAIGWNKEFENWTLSPSAVYRTNGVYTMIDFNFNAKHKNLYTGLGYSVSNQVSMAIGYEFADQLRITYSYGHATGAFVETEPLAIHSISIRHNLCRDRMKKHALINDLGIL